MAQRDLQGGEECAHLTRVIKRDKDRLAGFGVKLAPWRANGSKIVVITPGKWMAHIYKHSGIEKEMAAECAKYTDRPIEIKQKGTGLMETLRDAWAVVCPFSVAGVEAAVAGYPVFSTPMCPSWPISAGPLADIERPSLHDRYDWANSLAWATWRADEFHGADFKEYLCA